MFYCLFNLADSFHTSLFLHPQTEEINNCLTKILPGGMMQNFKNSITPPSLSMLLVRKEIEFSKFGYKIPENSR